MHTHFKQCFPNRGLIVSLKNCNLYTVQRKTKFNSFIFFDEAKFIQYLDILTYLPLLGMVGFPKKKLPLVRNSKILVCYVVANDLKLTGLKKTSSSIIIHFFFFLNFII